MKYLMKYFLFSALTAASFSQIYNASAKKDDQEYIDEKGALDKQILQAQTFPSLRQIRLQILPNESFFEAWNRYNDKGLLLKAVVTDPDFLKKWKDYGLNLYNELRVLIGKNKNSIDKEDYDFIMSNLKEFREKVQPNEEPVKIQIMLLDLGGNNKVLNIIAALEDGEFEELKTLAIQITDKIIELYQERKITAPAMKQAFTDLKTSFVDDPRVTARMYAQDPKTKDEQKELLGKILETFIQSSDKIAKNN